MSMTPKRRECLICGMPADCGRLHLEDLPPRLQCLKCDSELFAQSDGSCLTRDIAHGHETVPQALRKLDTALLEAWRSSARDLRLIVGGGVIRREVLGQLHYYRSCGYLLDYAEESPNHGAVLVRIRRS
jgi:hypothetical protein